MTTETYLKSITLSFFLFSFFYFLMKFLISYEKKKIQNKINKLNLSELDKEKLLNETDIVFEESLIEFTEKVDYGNVFIIIIGMSIIPIINFILLFFLLIDSIKNYLMVKKQLNILIKLSTKNSIENSLLFYNIYYNKDTS